VLLSLGVPAISQWLLARSEHDRESDLLVAELVKVQEARPPVWTSAPYVTLRLEIVQVGRSVSQAARAEGPMGDERASLEGKRRMNARREPIALCVIGTATSIPRKQVAREPDAMSGLEGIGDGSSTLWLTQILQDPKFARVEN
jgi:hypothetical protein